MPVFTKTAPIQKRGSNIITLFHEVSRDQTRCGIPALYLQNAMSIALTGGRGLTAHQWNLKILYPYRHTNKWRWEEAYEWHLSRVWRLKMPKVTVKIEGGGEVELLGGDSQDVIDLLLGKGVDEADLKTPGASVQIGGTL